MVEDGWCAAWCPRKISPKIVRGLGLAFRRKLKIQRVEGNFEREGSEEFLSRKEESEKEEEEEEEVDKGVRRRKGKIENDTGDENGNRFGERVGERVTFGVVKPISTVSKEIFKEGGFLVPP